jgi:hypothetical protein
MRQPKYFADTDTSHLFTGGYTEKSRRAFDTNATITGDQFVAGTL